jgi:hypothetical protein
MINSTWLIFGGLGITAIVAIVLGATTSSTEYNLGSNTNFDSTNNSGFTSQSDYDQPLLQSYEQPQNSYDDNIRYNMQPYGGTRKKKTKRSKKSKKYTKRSKK